MSILFDLFVIGPALLLIDKAKEINQREARKRTASIECLAFDALNQQAKDRGERDTHYRYEDPDLDGTMNDSGPDW